MSTENKFIQHVLTGTNSNLRQPFRNFVHEACWRIDLTSVSYIYFVTLLYIRSRSSSVSIGWVLDNRGLFSGKSKSSLKVWSLGRLVWNGNWGLVTPGIKRPGSEIEIYKVWSSVHYRNKGVSSVRAANRYVIVRNLMVSIHTSGTKTPMRNSDTLP